MNQVNDVQIVTIKIGKRYRKDMGDIETLAASIESIGLLQPIGINPNYQLIWGERRLRAFQLLGRNKIPTRIVPMVDIVKGEYAENEIRKNFTKSESAEIFKAYNLSDSKLGNNQYAPKQNDSQGFPHVENPDESTSCQSAFKAGFDSKSTAYNALKVVEKGTPLLIESMDNGVASIKSAAIISKLPPKEQDDIVARGRDEIKAAAKAIRQQETEQRREQRIEKLKNQAAGNAELDTANQYPVIYADPPWNYDFSG